MIRRSTRSASKKDGEQPNYEEKPISSSDSEDEGGTTKTRSNKKKPSPKHVKLEPQENDEETSQPKKETKGRSRKIISSDEDTENEKSTAKQTSERKKSSIIKAEPLSDRNTEESTASDDEGKSPQTKRKRWMMHNKSGKPANQPSITKFLSPKSRAISSKPVKSEPSSPTETPSKAVEVSTASEDDVAPAKEPATISEYEKQILRNIEERKKMFQMLVGDAKADFMKSVAPIVEAANKEKASKPSHRGFKRKSELDYMPTEPLRMSLRSRAKAEPNAIKDEPEETPAAKPKRPTSGRFALKDAYADQDEPDDVKFMENMIPLLEKEGELEKLPADLQDFLKLMQTFNIEERGVAKVAKSRIYSLAWHPSSSKLLVAAGDRDGNIGFWDVDEVEDKHHGVRLFGVHSHPINCLSFDKYNPTRLLSTSYDGYVRCLDFNSSSIDEVFSHKRTKDTWTAYHAQKDASTLVVSQSNGIIAVVDVRTKPGKAQNVIQCFEMSARTVSLHPTDDNLFMTCNRYGEAGIFDMRYTAENEDDVAVPVVEIPKSAKGVHGAFFSPLTGKYALTTNAADCLVLYDVANKSTAECLKSIDHNNFTGRWLTTFKAVWHPQREDVFVCGSMEQPRRVELFGAPSGQLLHNFNGDSLASVCSINTFHPTVPIFAGGNSSGRVHIFRP